MGRAGYHPSGPTSGHWCSVARPVQPCPGDDTHGLDDCMFIRSKRPRCRLRSVHVCAHGHSGGESRGLQPGPIHLPPSVESPKLESPYTNLGARKMFLKGEPRLANEQNLPQMVTPRGERLTSTVGQTGM